MSDTKKPTRLVVTLEGGVVTSICSDHPEEFAGIRVTVVDYDFVETSNATARVPQDNGNYELAIVSDREVENLSIDLDKAVKFHGCDCCDVETPGIRPDSGPHCGEPPEGFVVVERCDSCDIYEDDLAAAKAWGTDAHWMANEKSHNHLQAICRPPKEPTDVGWKTSIEMRCPTCDRMTYWYGIPSRLCEHTNKDGKKCKGSHRPTHEVQDHWKIHGSEL